MKSCPTWHYVICLYPILLSLSTKCCISFSYPGHMEFPIVPKKVYTCPFILAKSLDLDTEGS